MQKHRSLRGSLTSRIKDAVFSIFGEANLPCVNMTCSADDIKTWKLGAAARCHKKLFEPISSSEPSVTYMSRILEKVWTDSEKASEISVAFAISVAETLLNPKYESILINEETLKTKIRKNLVICDFFL